MTFIRLKKICYARLFAAVLLIITAISIAPVVWASPDTAITPAVKVIQNEGGDAALPESNEENERRLSEHGPVGEEKTGVLATLGLDWKLFLAQLVNFGVILFVLWKWVFTPVAKKLQERTDKIEKSLNDAERVAKEKQEFESWRSAEMAKARQEASAAITAAQTEAKKQQELALQQTKEQQDKLVSQSKTRIESEMNKAIAEAKSEIADMVTSASEKIIRQKLDEKKDKELIKKSLASI